MCEKPSHFKRDCQVKVVCHRCKKSDHIKPNCRVKMQESEVNVVHESKSSSNPIWEHCLTTEVLDQPVVRRKWNKCTHNTNGRNYTKRHQDIYVVWREEVPPHPRVATNH